MNEDFVVMAKKGRMVALGFFCLVFVAVGVLLLLIPFTEPVLPIMIGILTIVVFGFSFIYYVKVLVLWKPAVLITKEGIVDQSSYIGAGLINWDEIEAIDFISFSGQVYLAIFTHDRELIINRSSGVKKWFNRINTKLLPSQVNIPVNNLACSIDELVFAINEHWAERIKES